MISGIENNMLLRLLISIFKDSLEIIVHSCPFIEPIMFSTPLRDATPTPPPALSNQGVINSSKPTYQ